MGVPPGVIFAIIPGHSNRIYLPCGVILDLFFFFLAAAVAIAVNVSRLAPNADPPHCFEEGSIF